ncbi:MAG: hypothetical protein IJS97_08315, partial [Prevotella sp.]|nr:hypothetical protein [Prevotella sp.]
MMDLAEQYLYGIDSPLYNEPLYLLALQTTADMKGGDARWKAKTEWQLKRVERNQPGTTAEDFDCLLTNGMRTRISQVASTPQVLLLFYDPDCDHCHEVMAQLRQDERIRSSIATGQLTCIAICTGNEESRWRESLQELPAEWITVYDSTDVGAKGLYDLRRLPALYKVDGTTFQVQKKLSTSSSPIAF